MKRSKISNCLSIINIIWMKRGFVSSNDSNDWTETTYSSWKFMENIFYFIFLLIGLNALFSESKMKLPENSSDFLRVFDRYTCLILNLMSKLSPSVSLSISFSSNMLWYLFMCSHICSINLCDSFGNELSQKIVFDFI